MDLGEGLLKLTCVDAKLTRDTEIMGAMSPYITITFNGQKFKTKIHDDGGKEPVWGDEFTFEIANGSEELVLRVWDKDLTTSDAVGFVQIKLSSLIINEGVDDWFTIMYENQSAGDVHLISVFEPVGGSRYEQMKEELEAQNERLAAEAEEAKEKLAKLEEDQEKILAEIEEQKVKQEAEEAEMAAKLAEAEAKGDDAEEEIAALKAQFEAQKAAMAQQQYGLQSQLQTVQSYHTQMQNPQGAGYFNIPQNYHGYRMHQPPAYHYPQAQGYQQPGYPQYPQHQAYAQAGYGGYPQQQAQPQVTVINVGAGGYAQPQQPRQPIFYCPQNHISTWMNTIPYPGAAGVTCDICHQDIHVAYWFHHCNACSSDMCQNCGKQRQR